MLGEWTNMTEIRGIPISKTKNGVAGSIEGSKWPNGSGPKSALLCISGCIDQPTTRRLNRSMTTARNSQPSSVGM